ncbi:hypothetical protein TNCV_2909651 [Trichonephila clavipes]|nr:hypothetical protein TNCV_2909651 [Trichonephila clavipes]
MSSPGFEPSPYDTVVRRNPYSNEELLYILIVYGAVDCNGQAPRPSRSPDLTYMDFFWGHMKSLVCEIYVPLFEELITQISVAAGRKRDMPGIFQNKRNSTQHRCQACQMTSGHNLEHMSCVESRISSQRSRHCWRSPLPHASALIQRYFGCVLGEQQTKHLPHVAKVDLVWQLGV